MKDESEVLNEFNRFFTTRTLASTYKPYFLKSLLDLADYNNKSHKPFHGKQWIKETKNGLKVNLDFIASRFGYHYWDPHFKFRLKQSPHPREDVHIYIILNDFQKILGDRKQRPKITVFCSPRHSEIRRRIISRCIKPDVLRRLLKDCNIYEISKDGDSVIIPTSVIQFIRKNKPTLRNAIDFIIVSYLETCNTAPQIATKISEKPPISSLSKEVFNKIKEIQNHICFYCKKRGIDVREHVIPKNYVWETKAYNIVGACKSCNRDKWHNKLPELKIFKQVLERNNSELFYSLKDDSYSMNGYELQYNNCRKDYSKGFWKPLL